MIVTEESVVIDCPIGEVSAFFTDPDNMRLFMTNVIAYNLISGEAGEVGSIFHAVVKVAGRRLEIIEELTGVDQGRYQRRRGTDSPSRGAS
ncbi:SRPBCC family protein [Rhodococcus sp. NPDC003318]|uniref:SRPBCC family protein n=1 Tax=Rhodococcus sp. NPDC003318 TaxID=3364503 RepID=UPI0036A1640E